MTDPNAQRPDGDQILPYPDFSASDDSTQAPTPAAEAVQPAATQPEESAAPLPTETLPEAQTAPEAPAEATVPNLPAQVPAQPVPGEPATTAYPAQQPTAAYPTQQAAPAQPASPYAPAGQPDAWGQAPQPAAPTMAAGGPGAAYAPQPGQPQQAPQDPAAGQWGSAPAYAGDPQQAPAYAQPAGYEQASYGQAGYPAQYNPALDQSTRNNSIFVLVLSIVGIFMIPLIPSIIAWVWGNSVIKTAEQAGLPADSYSLAKGGKIVGIVGTIMYSALIVLGIILLVIVALAAAASSGGY